MQNSDCLLDSDPSPTKSALPPGVEEETPYYLKPSIMDPKAYHQVSSMCGLLEEPKNTRLEHKYGRDL